MRRQEGKALIEVVRTGCSRIVVLIGRWAIKIPNFLGGWSMFLKGLLGNTQELELSKNDWPEVCPAMGCSFLLIMPRATTLTDNEFLEHIEQVQCHEWRTMWNKGGNSYQIPVELKANSFGWLNGRVVAVDYGGGWR